MATDYILKRAIIEGSRDVTSGSSFPCRVIPDMVDIKEDITMLPYFSPFFMSDQQAYSEGDVVWLLTTDDFQVGYILGFAESPTGSTIGPVITFINDIEESLGLGKSSVYDLTFTRRQDDLIDFCNRSNKQSGRIYATGIVYVYGADGSLHMKSANNSVDISAAGEMTISGKLLKEKVNTEEIEAVKYTETLGSKESTVTGSSTENVSGNKYLSVVGSQDVKVLGNDSKTVTGKAKEILLQGQDTVVVAGGDTKNIAAGNFAISVGAGTATITTLLGSITLSAVAGGINLLCGGSIRLISTGITVSPLPVIPGIGPFNCLPMCPIAMVPHSGNVAGSPL